MLKKLLFRYKELILYGFFGLLTTIVNFTAYYLAIEIFEIHYIIANTLAFVVAVLFAFVTNKIYVFNSRHFHPKETLSEFTKFLTGRLLALGFETAFLVIFVELLNTNEFITKVIAAFFVVIINYVWSKLFVFKKQ